MAQPVSRARSMMRSAVVGEVLLGQRPADLEALREQEGVGHAAADDQDVDLADEVLEKVELGRDLGAADDGDHRPRRRLERLASSASSSACIVRPA